MKKISEKILFKGSWLILREGHFVTKKGHNVRWESVVRKRNTVGVVILAKLMPSERYILIKQFRPALNNYVIGLPAGLSDGDPAHALVELKEETGYVGKIKEVSPMLKSGTGMIDDSCYVIKAEVDEKAIENKAPKQELEDSEEIEVLLLKKEKVKNFLIKEKKKGTEIGAGLWHMFCMGL